MGRLLGTEDGGVKWLPEVKATPSISSLPMMADARTAKRGMARPVIVVTVLRRAHMAMRAVGLAVVDRAAHEGPATTLRGRCA
jgi:hypothetical protein